MPRSLNEPGGCRQKIEAGKASAGLGAAFIDQAATSLRKGGVCWMVANRHLPYEAGLARHFREGAEIGGDGAFKLFAAARPVARAQAAAAPPPRRRR